MCYVTLFYAYLPKSQGIELLVDNATKMLYTDSVSVVGGFVSTTTPPLWATLNGSPVFVPQMQQELTNRHFGVTIPALREVGAFLFRQ